MRVLITHDKLKNYFKAKLENSYLNIQNISDAMSCWEIQEKLVAFKIKTRFWFMQRLCAITGGFYFYVIKANF